MDAPRGAVETVSAIVRRSRAQNFPSVRVRVKDDLMLCSVLL